MAVVCLLGLTGAANADTLIYSSSKPLSTTNWTDVLNFSLFDTTLGTLNSVRFDLGGTVSGTGMAESLDASATNVALTLGSVLTLTRPDSSTLVVTNPFLTSNFSFTAFDGNINFAGTSGGSTGLQTHSASNFVVSSSGADLALFSASGGGVIGLGLGAAGQSSGTGSGNLITSFATQAAGNVSVTYDYTAVPVPEPESYAMMLAGLGLLAFAKRRQAAKSLSV